MTPARKALCVALVVAGLWPTMIPADSAPASLGRRLLGPVTSLAAAVHWVRFDSALREGDPNRAYTLAQRALELDPDAWQGWSHLGLHLAFTRGSVELERDPAERRRWVASGLEVLRQGTTRARRPEELHVLRGLVLASYVGPQARTLDWPGGPEGAVTAAITELQAAAELGHPRAGDLVQDARRMAAELGRGERPAGWADDDGNQ